ncbi:helix-turn-helix domain-containing protein [Chitinibacteraceae bacterium HSL-7]
MMLVREWISPSDGQGWFYQCLEDTLCPFQWHYHPEFELTFTLRARGTRYIGSDIDPFGEVDLALVAPGQPHTWHADPPADGALHQVQVVLFRPEWLTGLADGGLPELRALAAWLAGIRSGVVFSRTMAERLRPAFAELHAARGLPRLTGLLAILHALMGDEGARVIDGPGLVYHEDRRLQAALAHLQQHYTDAVTLADLAGAAGASPATLKRLFHDGMHTTFSALLASLRIGHACHLLLTTKRSIAFIADASGFPSVSQFYRKFIELKQMPPAQYRAALRA